MPRTCDHAPLEARPVRRRARFTALSGLSDRDHATRGIATTWDRSTILRTYDRTARTVGLRAICQGPATTLLSKLGLYDAEHDSLRCPACRIVTMLPAGSRPRGIGA